MPPVVGVVGKPPLPLPSPPPPNDGVGANVDVSFHIFWSERSNKILVILENRSWCDSDAVAAVVILVVLTRGSAPTLKIPKFGKPNGSVSLSFALLSPLALSDQMRVLLLLGND